MNITALQHVLIRVRHDTGVSGDCIMGETYVPLGAQLVGEGHENFFLEDLGDRILLGGRDSSVHDEEFHFEEVVGCQVRGDEGRDLRMRLTRHTLIAVIRAGLNLQREVTVVRRALIAFETDGRAIPHTEHPAHLEHIELFLEMIPNVFPVIDVTGFEHDLRGHGHR